MKCPAQNTKLGKVLRAMNKAGLASDTAVTARIRELRNDYRCEIPPAKPVKQLDGSTIYKYELKLVPLMIRLELTKERRRGWVPGVAA